MNGESSHCNLFHLSRYIDQELYGEDKEALEKHLSHCPFCQSALEEMSSLAAMYREGMEAVRSRVDFVDLEKRIVSRVGTKRAPLSTKLRDLFRVKRLLIPAAAVMTLFILSLLLPKTQPPGTAPSAIIKSFTGEISSVMILETPRSRQTIIWYKESS